MDARPITHQIHSVMGFRQDEGEQSGLERHYYELRQLYGDWPGEVRIHTWRADSLDVATAIDNQTSYNGWVALIGYSWGGQTAVNICNQLNRMGREVSALFLIDAVHRSRNPFRYYRSYYDWQCAIRVPMNVKCVWSFRQTTNYPRGNKIVVKEPTRHVEQEVFDRGVEHEYIDDNPKVWKHVMREIKKLAK